MLLWTEWCQLVVCPTSALHKRNVSDVRAPVEPKAVTDMRECSSASQTLTYGLHRLQEESFDAHISS